MSAPLTAGDAWLAYIAATSAWNAMPTAKARKRMTAALRAFSLAMGLTREETNAAVAQLDQTLAREAIQRKAA